MEMNFCRRCGGRLHQVEVDAYRCDREHMQFRSPAPTASIVLLDGDSFVLSRRAIEPNRGLIDCFGGFVEPGETFEEAAVREVQEELGIGPRAYTTPKYLGSYASTYRYQEEDRPVLSVYFTARLGQGVTLTPADDSEAVVRIPIAQVDWSVISGDDTKAALRDVLEWIKK